MRFRRRYGPVLVLIGKVQAADMDNADRKDASTGKIFTHDFTQPTSATSAHYIRGAPFSSEFESVDD